MQRVREEHAGDDANLFENQTRQDAILLDLQRACEGSIDAAMHLVRVHRLGVPQETREAFDASLATRLRRMVGFRTVAIHEYHRLNLDIVRSIVLEPLGDFLEFTRLLLRQ